MKAQILDRFNSVAPRRRRAAAVAVVLVLLGAAVLAFTRSGVLSGEAQVDAELQTAIVRSGVLVLLASGTGMLTAEDEILLGFGASGTVSALHVHVGDQVQAGDVLAEQAERKELEAGLAADQLALIEAQEALEEAHSGADLARAEAQLALADAQDALKVAERPWRVQQQGNRASSTSVKAALAAVIVARENMERSEGRYNETPGEFEKDREEAQAYKDYAAASQLGSPGEDQINRSPSFSVASRRKWQPRLWRL